MNWIKDLFAQFKSKTVWGVLVIVLVQITGLDSESITGIVEQLVNILEALAYVLTIVGVNHKLEKWIEMLKKKPS